MPAKTTKQPTAMENPYGYSDMDWAAQLDPACAAARAYLRGRLSPVERKNGGQVAAVKGDATPYGLQHLWGRATGDAEAVRDAWRPYLLEHLGTPHGVVVRTCLKRGLRGTMLILLEPELEGTGGHNATPQLSPMRNGQ